MNPPTLAWLSALAAELDEALLPRLDLPALAKVIDDAGDAGSDPCDQAAVLLVEISGRGHRRLAAMSAITWLGEAGFGVECDTDTHDRLHKLITAAAHGEATRTDAAALLHEHLATSKGRPMFERFTQRARKVMTLSQVEAGVIGTDFIGTEHLLLGMLAEGDGVAAKVLGNLGFTLEDIRQQVRTMLGDAAGNAVKRSPPFTPRAKKVLELSLREALALGHNYIGTEHMLLGIVREGQGLAATVLGDLPRVRQAVLETLSGLTRPKSPSDATLDLYRVEVVGETEELTAQIEAELQLLVRQGDEPAKHRVIQANLRTVLEYVLRQPPSAASALDLVQAGNDALARAVDLWAEADDRTPFAEVAMPLITEAVADAGVRSRPSGLSCSFCGKDQKEVKKLIAGPNSIYICDECVALCTDIVAEEIGQQATASVRCSRCKADLSKAGKVETITVDDAELRVFICGVCRTVLGTT